MADITVSYEEMRASASKLDQGRTSIDEQLGSLKTMIDNLVQTSFKTQSASPKFQESYDQWTTGAKEAIGGLEGMSSFINKAITQHQELDTNLQAGLSQ